MWNNDCEQRFVKGQRVFIPGHGPGVVVEVFERQYDIDGNVRTPYRVWLDVGREWFGHPWRMRTVTNGGQPATSRKAKEMS